MRPPPWFRQLQWIAAGGVAAAGISWFWVISTPGASVLILVWFVLVFLVGGHSAAAGT